MLDTSHTQLYFLMGGGAANERAFSPLIVLFPESKGLRIDILFISEHELKFEQHVGFRANSS